MRRSGGIVLFAVLALLFLGCAFVSTESATAQGGSDRCVCPECPHCADCTEAERAVSAKQQKIAACEATGDGLRKDNEALKEELQAAADDQEMCSTQFTKLKDSLDTCLDEKSAAHKCCQNGTKSCEAVEAEKEKLLSVRHQLAASLEESEQRNAKLSVAHSDLEEEFAAIKQEAQVLRKAKSDVEESSRSHESITKQLSEALKVAEAAKAELERQVIKLEKQMASLKDNLLKVELRHLSEKQQSGYLFSMPQLVSGVKSIWSFSQAVCCFATTSLSEAVRSRVPPQWAEIPREWTTKASTLWEQNISQNWREQAQPAMDKSWRALSSHDATRAAVSVFQTKMSSSAGQLYTDASQVIGPKLESVLIETVSGLEYINDLITTTMIDPMCISFPEVRPLIPSSPVDRICMIAFVSFVITFVLVRLIRHACCIAAILLFAIKLAVPCCWCRLCGRRAQVSEANIKPKSKKLRKAFQPAGSTPSSAAATPSPNSPPKSSTVHKTAAGRK